MMKMYPFLLLDVAAKSKYIKKKNNLNSSENNCMSEIMFIWVSVYVYILIVKEVII